MRLHHIGIVVSDIEKGVISYREEFGCEVVSPLYDDPLQEVRVQFLSAGWDKGVTLELIEPSTESSPVRRFLQEDGGGLNHLCYEVADMALALSRAREHGGLIVREPSPAAAFDGRNIAFVFTKDRRLIEFVEEEARDG